MNGSDRALGFTGVRLRLNGQLLLDDISADWAPGGISVLLGPNGAGKTLLLRLARGLLQPDTGTIRWGGRAPATLGTRIGYVPQQPVMLRRSVRANLAYALGRAGVPRAQRAPEIERGLECAGLTDRADAAAPRLSGGQRQRLAIARAWVQRPLALLLDEPCAHLDPAAAASVERTIRDIAADGTKIILTTHDLGQAERLADEVHFLRAGRLLEHGPADRFFATPESEHAGRFLAGERITA
ncbi:MAG: ATP-binding cassette domain-containing protein [Halofilum sp. (in: g-proteobacteria)]|nr:ATP-binding cassette domain-containing protein [Halofilum sp. (in: g-proteobacteria)]